MILICGVEQTAHTKKKKVANSLPGEKWIEVTEGKAET